MGQMVMVDEDELNRIKTKAIWCDYYREDIQEIQRKLYPNFISVDPVSGYGYDEEILYEMMFEITNKRKPWWRRLCEFLF